MKVPYSYLEDQVKDGFYVDSKMRCCWAAQLEVLEIIDAICQKHNIQYFADWGSMLGAVRHHGMIPWDDDLDITMKRPDYNKFLKVAKEELPESYHILNYRNDEDYWDVMSRVVNTRYINIDYDFLDQYHNFPFSTGIDIFPMDFVPTNQGEAEVLGKLAYEVKSVADTYGEGFLSEEEFQEALDYLEILCNMKIERTGNVRARLYDILVSLYSIYTEEESEEIAIMYFWLENGSHAYPKRYYQDSVRLPFEMTTIAVSSAYDTLLRRKYGDYMKMVRVGGTHDYPYYNKQIEMLEENGIDLLKFKYEDRVERNHKEEKDKISFNIEDLLVLENAHGGVFKLLVLQDRATVMQLLSSCQECAISLGNKAERVAADCEILVRSLEEYCELIFQIHQLLQQGEVLDAEGVYRILQEQLQGIKEEFEKEYDKKKKIVFIVDKAERWKSLKSVWKAAKEDKNSIVSVIAVPYYYKRIDGSIIEEHYEKDLFPEEAEVLGYQEYDLKEYHPDVIFINNPYDEYNYFTSVHPYFYSSNLVQFTDKLIYIPWFTITELTREDERGWQTMQHFVTMPGVVNADKVIVQSEQMKEAYVDYLTDWAGEDTKAIWEEKISGMGSPLLDTEDTSEDEIAEMIPEEWKKVIYKEDGNRKRILLYSIGGSGFVERGIRAAEKLKSVLELVKENSEEIAFVWYANLEMETTLKTSYPDLWKDYVQIMEEYRKQAWGIYVENPDWEMLVAIGDAYYGDGCALSQKMVMAEKPVMIQNFDC